MLVIEEISLPYFRTKILPDIPWVELLDGNDRCDGIKWSQVPMKEIWDKKTHRKHPLSVRKKNIELYRCHFKARWYFTATTELNPNEKSYVTDGHYCFKHLYYSCLRGDLTETVRIDDWLENWFQENSDKK